MLRELRYAASAFQNFSLLIHPFRLITLFLICHHQIFYKIEFLRLKSTYLGEIFRISTKISTLAHRSRKIIALRHSPNGRKSALFAVRKCAASAQGLLVVIYTVCVCPKKH